MKGNVIFFGGGALLVQFVSLLRKDSREVAVVTSSRHLAERLQSDGSTFADLLDRQGVVPLVSTDVAGDTAVHRLIRDGSIGLSLGAAWIFRRPFIDLFKGRLFNFHGARLPQNRGGGGFSWQILTGSRLGFALIHRLDEGIDTGPVVFMHEFVFPSGCRVPLDYYAALADQYLAVVPGFLGMVDAGAVTSLGQAEHLSSYWPRLSTEHHGVIDWSWSASEIERFICAFDDPYSGATTFVTDRRVSLKGCVFEGGDGQFHPFQAGLIYRKASVGLFVAARDGALLVRTALDDHGRSVVDDLRVGDRLHTPAPALSAARSFRAIYVPSGLKS